MPTKADIRRRMLAMRDALDASVVGSADHAFAVRLETLPEWRTARLPALYVSFRNEASTRAILAARFGAGLPVLLPRSDGDTLRLHRVERADGLVAGRFGMPEPSPDAPEVSPGEPDFFLVPGVAFDRRGVRLGFGKGYYDRLLAATSAPVVALAYGFQIVPEIPEEPHDRRMDFILTETKTIRCG